MAWRVANSLETLRAQLNSVAPRRSKVSDGGIGDEDHQNRASDHNPWYPPPKGGVVTARDFTHDPAGGLDCHWLASMLKQHRDLRIKYVIWDGRIMSGASETSPWVWRRYTGANPHTSHLHLSVVANPASDNTAPWAGISPTPPPPPKEDDVELTDIIRFDDGREVTVRKTLAEGWQNSYDTLNVVRSLAAEVAQLKADVAELKQRPAADVDEAQLAAEMEARGITGGASAAEMVAILNSVRFGGGA